MRLKEIEGLWEGLSGGLEDLYRRYAQERKLREQSHLQQINEARDQYEKRQNAITGEANVQRVNTKKLLATHGLGQSGEGLQAELLNHLGKNTSLQGAADNYEKTVRGLQQEKEKAQLESDRALSREIGELSRAFADRELEEKKLQQQQALADREWSLQKSQSAWEREQAEKQLAEDKRQFDLSHSDTISHYEQQLKELKEKLSEKEEDKEGITLSPDLTPAKLYKAILEENARQYATWNTDQQENNESYRQGVRSAVESIIQDPSLEEGYRKAVEIYARIGGFLA